MQRVEEQRDKSKFAGRPHPALAKPQRKKKLHFESRQEARPTNKRSEQHFNER